MGKKKIMEKLNRYAVVIDTYVYAQGDEEAKKMAHDIKRKINGDHTKIVEIHECTYGALEPRELLDLSEPKVNGDTVWTEEDDLPF